jgi:hypothetical protein
MSEQFIPGDGYAIAMGCLCTDAKNNNGQGTVAPSGRTVYVCNSECPFHGFAATGQLDENGHLLPEEESTESEEERGHHNR